MNHEGARGLWAFVTLGVPLKHRVGFSGCFDIVQGVSVSRWAAIGRHIQQPVLQCSLL